MLGSNLGARYFQSHPESRISAALSGQGNNNGPVIAAVKSSGATTRRWLPAEARMGRIGGGRCAASVCRLDS